MATVIESPEEALRKRATAGVDRLVEIGPEAIMEALAAPNEVEFFGFITRELASHARPNLEELAEEQLTAARFRERMTKLAGGLITAAEAAQLANWSSPQAAYKAAAERRVIVVDDRGRKLFPRFQFDEKLREPIAKLLRATPSSSGWEIIQYLFGHPEGLAGKQPIEMLRSGKADDIDAALRFGRALED